MNIFSYESRFSQVFLKLSYACCLNVMWFVCSLPIFTIGASTAALYSVTLKIADDRDRHIAQKFFSAFRTNFKQATRVWLIMLAVGVLLGADGYIAAHMRLTTPGPLAVMWTLNLALIIGAAVVYTIILIFIFPLIAWFENTDAMMFKNALLIGTHYLFCTISVAAIHFAMFFAVVALFTPLILFGEGLCALLSSYLIINVFRVISYRPEEEDEEEDEKEAEETAQ